MDLLQNKDILLAVWLGVGLILLMRFLPRIQAKMLGIPFVTAAEAKRRMDLGEDMLVLDVRTAGEFTGDLGHIEGALNLDVADLGTKLGELGDKLEPYKTQPILITCRTHNRSPKAARILYQNGFKKLMILENGMSGWTHAGYPSTLRR